MGQIIKNIPYYQQAYELLKGKILSGVLLCGEKINESKLSREMGISRSPLREAMRILEQEGLIISSNGVYIVNPLDANILHDVYECRIGLESYAARLATIHFTQHDFDILTGCIEKCQKADPKKDASMLVDLNTYFHDHIVSLTKNDYIIAQIGRIQNIVILSRIKELQYYNRDLTYAYNDHIKIAEAMLIGNEDLVEQLMRKHLSNNMLSLMP